MPQQQSSITTVLAMLTQQGLKLDAFKKDFDDYREEMPENYAPRRETDKAFAAVNERNNDHEARIRMLEGQLPSARFSAYKDTTQAREKAQADTTQSRFTLDERTIATLQSVLLMVAGALLYFLLNHMPR